MGNKYKFTSQDIAQIREMGLKTRDVEKQLSIYRRGINYLALNRPCKINDGIISLGTQQKKELVRLYEQESKYNKIIKFVPASGAASRMFADWHALIKDKSIAEKPLEKEIIKKIKKMPFIPLIEKDDYGQRLLKVKDMKGLLKFILFPDGLNYSWLPKALIPFHLYDGKDIRTAIEEHIYEAASYITNSRGVCRLHFTVSEEHKNIIASWLAKIKKIYEEKCRVKFKIDLSVQSASTNIIAVDENNMPFRDENGMLVFRPGGHGALLENLNKLDADLIFVRNIDNVVPSNILKKILPYKKMLGGFAIRLRQDIFEILNKLEKDEYKGKMDLLARHCNKNFNIIFESGFHKLTEKQKKRRIILALNRPLRVCAMVRNVGEPGGGPFWINEKNSTQSLQIVEGAHVNKADASQLQIWSRASYFNPVDMVCCIKNHRGEKYDLKKYVDTDAFLISLKNEKGHKIKAQEMPGLWNGAMARWNTVFVELPLIVFNPVKTVYDLLRSQHQAHK